MKSWEEGGLPGESLLKQDLFVTIHKKDKWIVKECSALNLLVEKDIIVTMEPVRFWYDTKGQNNLFFTHGSAYEEGGCFNRASSFAPWAVDAKPLLALYVTGVME